MASPILRFIPSLGIFLPFNTALAVLVTALNAFLGLEIIPFLPYEVEAFTVAIPTLIALLNLDLVFTDFLFVATVKSVKACSNLIRSILPRSAAISRSCCPGCVCKAPKPIAAPVKAGL